MAKGGSTNTGERGKRDGRMSTVYTMSAEKNG